MSLDNIKNTGIYVPEPAKKEYVPEKKESARGRKRRLGRYKFSDREHSPSGIAGTCLGLCAICLLICAVVISVSAHGGGGQIVGGLGALSLILSVAGIITSLAAFKRTDIFFGFPIAGLCTSAGIWFFAAILLVAGL